MADVKPDSDETRHLLEQARAGDRAAFETLFARYRAELRHAVELRLDARLRARVDASDVVQEGQLEALRRLDDFLQRRPMPFHLWLRKTVCERLHMLRRRHLGAARRAAGREVTLPDRSSVLLSQRLLARAPTPSQQLAQAERARRVRQAVARLPVADREILVMRNHEGLSYEEIGYLLDLDPAAARKRHGRALLRLHAQLTAAGLTESQL